MTALARPDAVASLLRETGAQRLIAIDAGVPSLLAPNALVLLTGKRPRGPRAVSIDAGGTLRWAALHADEAEISALIGDASRVALVGLESAPEAFCEALERSGAQLLDAGEALQARAATKTAAELAAAARAIAIAQAAHRRMLELAVPGIAEHELAAELDAQMARDGAQDNFMLLCSGATGGPVRAPTSRRLARGDVIGIELSPSVDCQFVQICRTVVLGEASAERRAHYGLLVEAFEAGLRAIRPGVSAGAVAQAVDGPLIEAGYGEYCRPPFMRVRGHGLGLASVSPGGLERSNETLLEQGMLFVLHPNQHLPGSGYMLCGETVIVGERGARSLGGGTPALAELAL